ncbi:hypothetical protein [Sphingomonas sp.]|uniref:hypothetical protein n=1 Tax=Sphingomonas sp. TaxID=28214 RepID=UPI002BD741BC|nr:hypothetical protein [Sphingomonas sp.]HTG37404.1 hypothetical protein [Sphingomonas sp.]
MNLFNALIVQTGEELCVAARDVDHAAEVFVCFWAARTGGAPGDFAIGRGAPPAYRGHVTVDAVERGDVAGVLVLQIDEMVAFEPAVGA